VGTTLKSVWNLEVCLNQIKTSDTVHGTRYMVHDTRYTQAKLHFVPLTMTFLAQH